MDNIDYTFKFSTELVVVTLSLFIIGINFAGAKSLDAFNSSLFSKLLSYHPQRNIALYNTSTAVKTVVSHDSNTLSANPIKVVLASQNFDSTSADGNSTDTLVANNTIEKQDPASVDQMIADQIKVYDTVPGDTMASIAAKYGISVDTIKWANNLSSDQIKPGWNLVILPVSGVLHKVTANDTLPDIAKKFHADINQIISYNGLEDDSDTQDGQLLIIPGGSIPAPVVAAAPRVVRNVVRGKIVYEPVPDDITDYSGGSDHTFPYGQCTYYASKLRGGVPWGGNAKDWLRNAAAYGAIIGQTPKVGAIVVTTENRRYGHVAIVKAVESGRFLITEMNYKGRGIIDERWLDNDSGVIRGFIY